MTRDWVVRAATCSAETSRLAESVPCDKVAVAVALEGDYAYPVCKHHARGRTMMPLTRVIEESRAYSRAPTP